MDSTGYSFDCALPTRSERATWSSWPTWAYGFFWVMLSGVHHLIQGKFPYDDDMLPVYIRHLHDGAFINGWQPVTWWTSMIMLDETGSYAREFVIDVICLPRGSFN